MTARGGTLGDFERVEQLAAGGGADVWAARDLRSGALRALKIARLPHEELLDTLRRQAAIQSRVRHPNVLPVLELLEGPDGVALVMPLVQGPTLTELWRELSPSPAEVVGLLRAVTRGAQAAHAYGFAHRDLKPGNVLVASTAEGLTPQVTDFGLLPEVMSDEERARMRILGHPRFTAPELIEGPLDADRRADFWSIGVALYALLSGELPFRHPHWFLHVPEATRDALARVALPPPAKSLVAELLEVDPERRLADAEVLLQRLEGLAPGADATLGPGGRLCREVAARRWTPVGSERSPEITPVSFV